MVCKLNKALYGLKQAPRAWFEKLHSALVSFGFRSAKSDQSLFFKVTSSCTIYALLYVDDILITGNNSDSITALIHCLHKQFALKDLGPLKYFLRIQISTLSNGGLHLSQRKYITDLLIRANMQNAKGMKTPMTSGLKLMSYRSTPIHNVQLCRSIVGALQYITITRPELAYSVNRVCQFMQNPLESHWIAVKRILRYLNGTLDTGLVLKPCQSSSLCLQGYCDADWASDIDDRRSTSGYCVFPGQNLISWQSKKQHTVSRSSTEAEYRSLAQVVAEISWISSLLDKLKSPPSRIPIIWCDNLSTVHLSANLVLHARTKHIKLDLYFVREKVAQGP